MVRRSNSLEQFRQPHSSSTLTNSVSAGNFSNTHFASSSPHPRNFNRRENATPPPLHNVNLSTSKKTISTKKTILLNIDEKLFPPPRGGHCKISALAHLDAIKSKEHGIINVPLLSLQSGERSVRKIAKEHNSVQGEVLQKQDLCEIAKEIGYGTQILSCPDVENFRDTIYQCLKENNPPLVVFPVASNGKPRTESNPPEWCEHGALIVGLDPKTSEVTLAHWNETYGKIPLDRLYKSMQNLKPTRSQESYLTIWKQNGKRNIRNPIPPNYGGGYKYPDVTSAKEGYKHENLLQSITPANNTGFKNCLFSFVPDLSHPRWKNKPFGKQMLNVQSSSISIDARDKISRRLKNCLYELHGTKVREQEKNILYGVHSIYITDLSVDPRVREGFKEKYDTFDDQLSYLKNTRLANRNKTRNDRESLKAIIDELVDQLLTEPTTPPLESQQFLQWLKQNGKENQYRVWLYGEGLKRH